MFHLCLTTGHHLGFTDESDVNYGIREADSFLSWGNAAMAFLLLLGCVCYKLYSKKHPSLEKERASRYVLQQLRNM